MISKTKSVVLAAGKGTRLQTADTDAPKVMREALGKPLLRYVLDALSFMEKNDITIVVGYKKDMVTSYFKGYRYTEQKEQMGTGHAVIAAREHLIGFSGDALICYGDMPAIKRETYEALIREHNDRDNDCTILTGESSIPLPYGRIIRGGDGGFLQVVEDRDCTPEQLKITELNSGVYVFRTQMLLSALDRLKNDNTQGEYYLTDVPAIMLGDGAKVGLFKRDLGDEIIGVNTQEQLEQVEHILMSRHNFRKSIE